MTPIRKPKVRKPRPLPNPRLPKRLAKLLVFSVDDHYELAYELGKHDIALQQYRVIKTNENVHLNPKMAVIRYNKDEDIRAFIEKSGIKAFRIFKKGRFRKAKFKSFLYSTANNLLGLTKGGTIRIWSKDEKLQKKFYDVCLRVNAEQKFNVTFDYDKYDVSVQLRLYNEPDAVWVFVLTEGLDEIAPKKDRE